VHCDTCKSDRAAIIRIKFVEAGKIEYCDMCSDLTINKGAIPDVYLPSKGGIQTEENLCDPKTRESVPYSSKREKAAVLKRLGLRQSELAERTRGARRAYEGPDHSKRTYFS